MPNDPAVELPTVIQYGVEWDGSTWDRILFGDTEPGEHGLAFCFDRSEPWVIRTWGLRATGADMGPQAAFDEYLEGSPDLDLNGLPGAPPTLGVGAYVAGAGQELFGPSPAICALELVGLEEVEVPAGSFDMSLHVRFGLGGEFFGVDESGESPSFSDLCGHPTQVILRWDPAPGFGTALELASPWE